MRRKIAIERQTAEIGRGQRAQIDSGRPGQDARPQQRIAQHQVGDSVKRLWRRAPIGEGAAQRQQGVLALENHRAVKRPQRAREGRALQPQQHLGDGWSACHQVCLGKGDLELERERIRGHELARKANRDADGVHPCAAQTGYQFAREVAVEGIALGIGIARDLVRRGQGKGCPVRGEIELQRRVGGRDHAQARADCCNCVGIPPGIVEALTGAQDVQRRANPGRHCSRFAAHAQQGQQDELRLVVERAPALQAGDAPLDAVTEQCQWLALQQGQKAIKVGVDGQHLDALGTQETRQCGNGGVGRRGITGRRKDEGELHAQSIWT